MVKKAKRTEIYEAAAKVFAEKGFHGARIQDVANELGMKKGSLYYYINDKNDLLKGLVEDVLQEILEEGRNIQRTRHDPPEKLRLAIASHLRLFMNHRHVFGIFLNEELAMLNDFSDANIFDLMKTYDRVMMEILQEGIDKGDFRPDLDIKLTVFGIFGMCNYTYKWYDPAGELPLQEVARLFADLALNGVMNNS